MLERQLVAGLHAAAGQAAQHEAGHFDLAFGNAAHRVQAHPPLRDDDRVQYAVHRDELDQRGRAEFGEKLVQVELPFAGPLAAGQPARAGLDLRLEPPPLTFQGVPARGGHLGVP